MRTSQVQQSSYFRDESKYPAEKPRVSTAEKIQSLAHDFFVSIGNFFSKIRAKLFGAEGEWEFDATKKEWVTRPHSHLQKNPVSNEDLMRCNKISKRTSEQLELKAVQLELNKLEQIQSSCKLKQIFINWRKKNLQKKIAASQQQMQSLQLHDKNIATTVPM